MLARISFHVVGLDRCGALVSEQMWLRGQIEVRLAAMPRALVGGHRVRRRLQVHGHDKGEHLKRAASNETALRWFVLVLALLLDPAAVLLLAAAPVPPPGQIDRADRSEHHRRRLPT